LKKGQRCVVILADSIRNYMTKHLSDDWMYDKGFVPKELERDGPRVDTWWANKRIGDLDLSVPLSIGPEVTCREAIEVMSMHSFDMIPVQTEGDGKVLGVLTKERLTSMITQNTIHPSDACVGAIYKQFNQVRIDTTLSELSCVFDRDHYALVVAEQKCFVKGSIGTRSVVHGVVTRIDLLNFIANKEKEYVQKKSESALDLASQTVGVSD